MGAARRGTLNLGMLFATKRNVRINLRAIARHFSLIMLRVYWPDVSGGETIRGVHR